VSRVEGEIDVLERMLEGKARSKVSTKHLASLRNAIGRADWQTLQKIDYGMGIKPKRRAKSDHFDGRFDNVGEPVIQYELGGAPRTRFPEPDNSAQ
jgi:hypothetical protein